ncbi:hypothetical protein OG394_14220 [Kribbella sp. NBC_01245]|nr:hypothetical protein [Kribbella sp. NBC_01245]
MKGHSLRHLGGRLAGFDVLINDNEAELVGFAVAGDSLRRERDPLWVVVGVDLACGGDPEVDDCPQSLGCPGQVDRLAGDGVYRSDLEVGAVREEVELVIRRRQVGAVHRVYSSIEGRGFV